MAKLGKFVESGGDSQMNKRQKKKRFKKLYGMNPKQYQQAMQLVSLEEPLKKIMDSETTTFTDFGSCLERIKDGLQKSVSVLGKLSCEAFCFCLEELGRELKKRRQK
jgi:methylphosphotriester-DNA--protein-cysteine methyltransferase